MVALGGGSVMDTAKAAACICTGTRTVHSFLGHADELPGKGLPVIAIPTTAGTASEVTRVSVLSDPQEHVKYSMHNDALFADVALVDPELTYTLPKHSTASTGMDVLLPRPRGLLVCQPPAHHRHDGVRLVQARVQVPAHRLP